MGQVVVLEVAGQLSDVVEDLDHAIQLLGGDAAIVQRLPGNVGREIERRRLGQGALPAGERGRPRTTQRDVRALEPHV